MGGAKDPCLLLLPEHLISICMVMFLLCQASCSSTSRGLSCQMWPLPSPFCLGSNQAHSAPCWQQQAFLVGERAALRELGLWMESLQSLNNGMRKCQNLYFYALVIF